MKRNSIYSDLFANIIESHLVYKLAQMGPDTNLEEDTFKSVQDTLGKALENMANFKLNLAQVHILKERKMDRDLNRLVKDVQKTLFTQQPTNERLIAYLGANQSEMIASVD